MRVHQLNDRCKAEEFNRIRYFSRRPRSAKNLKRSQKIYTELMGDKVVFMAFEHFRRFRCRKRLNYCSRAKINNFTAPNYVDDCIISTL